MRDEPARGRDADADSALLLKAFLVLAIGFALIVGAIAVATRGARADTWTLQIERITLAGQGVIREVPFSRRLSSSIRRDFCPDFGAPESK